MQERVKLFKANFENNKPRYIQKKILQEETLIKEREKSKRKVIGLAYKVKDLRIFFCSGRPARSRPSRGTAHGGGRGLRVYPKP